MYEAENEVPFRYNYAHDVESLFWLAVLILFFNEDIRARPETKEITAIRREYSAYVFPGNMSDTRAKRTSLISNPMALLKYASWFGNSFDQFLDPLLRIVLLFGPVYTEIYMAVKDGTFPKNEMEALELLYYASITSFETCQELSNNIEIRPRKSKGLDQEYNTSPRQPDSNSNNQQPPESRPNNQQPPESEPSEHRTRKREHEDAEREEEEYKILGAPKYPRRE